LLVLPFQVSKIKVDSVLVGLPDGQQSRESQSLNTHLEVLNKKCLRRRFKKDCFTEKQLGVARGEID
jgi:hypothetical protein